MSFFVTSVSKGDGANYGGLAGADAHCQTLAAAAGRGDVRWVAYLSTQGPGAVNAGIGLARVRGSTHAASRLRPASRNSTATRSNRRGWGTASEDQRAQRERGDW